MSKRKSSSSSSLIVPIDLLATADRLLSSVSKSDDPKLVAQIALCGAALHSARCGKLNLYFLWFVCYFNFIFSF